MITGYHSVLGTCRHETFCCHCNEILFTAYSGVRSLRTIVHPTIGQSIQETYRVTYQ